MDVKIFLFIFLTLARVNCDCNKAQDCITDIKNEDCPKGEYLVENQAVENCCPKCVRRIDLSTVSVCGVNTLCAPGLKCENRACVLDQDSCLKYLHYKDPMINEPSCNIDGTYAAVQCKGDDLVGRCFCVDERGNRIFGIEWASDADDMTCACSRRRAELIKNGRADSITLHCSSNGNYEELQCDSRLCWCANKKTGRPESTVVPEDLVSQLPCYRRDTYGDQYMRYCESKADAIVNIKNELRLHGTLQVTMDFVNCDYDGTFGVYQIAQGIAYCSWRDGLRIGSWQSEAGANLATVNCNCARDTKYFEEAGKAMTLSCLGNGNYMPVQHLNGRPYCVDSDGFPTTDLQDPGVILDC